MTATAHFLSSSGQRLADTLLWRAPVCEALWLDTAPDTATSPSDTPECGCDRCGGRAMILVGPVAADQLVALAQNYTTPTPTVSVA